MKDKINIYTCPLGHQTITRDIDEGVTPFMIRCMAHGCNELARSCMYHCDQSLTPKYEWFAPTPKQISKMDKGMQEHCRKGGLDFRLIDRLDKLCEK